MSKPKTKIARWWEYECPDCDTSNSLDVPPFPASHACRECGRAWDVQKLNAAGLVVLCRERVPA